jgi:hypothetical protein
MFLADFATGCASRKLADFDWRRWIPKAESFTSHGSNNACPLRTRSGVTRYGLNGCGGSRVAKIHFFLVQ